MAERNWDLCTLYLEPGVPQTAGKELAILAVHPAWSVAGTLSDEQEDRLFALLSERRSKRAQPHVEHKAVGLDQVGGKTESR
jgi:hypothetical protein